MKYKKIYFVGIKGVGMTSLALIAKEAGILVRGSDLGDEFITDQTLLGNGIDVSVGFDTSDLANFIGETKKSEVLVVTTSAHGGYDNPQVVYAQENNIDIHTHGFAVGAFMSGELFDRSFTGISVAGSHGKTTITSMIATVFTRLGLDPSYTVGTSRIFPVGNPGHLGGGEYFIAEADEYVSELQYDKRPKLLYQNPRIVIVSNIDYDHPDVYKTIEEIELVFDEFFQKIPQGGLAIVNGDDERLMRIAKKVSTRIQIITYGISSTNTYWVGNYKEEGHSIRFTVNSPDGKSEYEIHIPGVHNIINALSVIALCRYLKFSQFEIADALHQFSGSKRRFETVGKSRGGAVIIDDYAHHPEEITKTLSAARLAYPNHKIICVFQPHSLSRTEALLEDFANAFAGVDKVILMPVFITKRESDIRVEYDTILASFKKSNSNCEFIEKDSDVVEYLNNLSLSKDTIVITMGAGDVYRVAQRLSQ